MRRPRALVPTGLAALALLAGLPTAAGAQSSEPPLSIGLTENDPRVLVPAGPTAGTAANVVALKPAYVRVLIPWERLQPIGGRKPNWDAPFGGCPRINPGCRSERGMRGLLNAIKQRQAEDGGWKILAVPYFTPLWAMADTPSGCQKARKPPHPGTDAADRRLPAAPAGVQRPGRQGRGEGRLRLPVDELYHPGFLQPQRLRCSATAKAVSPMAYARLVRAAAQELRPGQQIVLGSLAGLQHKRVYGASALEFIRGLPRDVACLDAPLHLRPSLRRDAGRAALVGGQRSRRRSLSVHVS